MKKLFILCATLLSVASFSAINYDDYLGEWAWLEQYIKIDKKNDKYYATVGELDVDEFYKICPHCSIGAAGSVIGNPLIISKPLELKIYKGELGEGFYLPKYQNKKQQIYVYEAIYVLNKVKDEDQIEKKVINGFLNYDNENLKSFEKEIIKLEDLGYEYNRLDNYQKKSFNKSKKTYEKVNNKKGQ